jgi:hypothetical protein
MAVYGMQRLIAGTLPCSLGLLAIHYLSAPGDKKHEKNRIVIESGIELLFLTGTLATGFAGPYRNERCSRN